MKDIYRYDSGDWFTRVAAAFCMAVAVVALWAALSAFTGWVAALLQAAAVFLLGTVPAVTGGVVLSAVAVCVLTSVFVRVID